jgi:urease accessory protein UreF
VVARRASAAAGAALARAAAAAFPAHAEQLDSLRSRTAPGALHGAVSLGFLCGLLRLSACSCGRALLVSQLRDGCSAATRLGLVGPMAAAALQARAATRCESLLADALSRNISVHDAASAAPLADTLQAGHDALFARLFQS